MYHSWFLQPQRVLPQLRLHLPRHHLHHRSQHRPTVIQYRQTEMLRLQYPKGMEVWMRSYGETRCMTPQKPKSKIKKRESEEVWWKYFRKASGRFDAEKCTNFHFVSWFSNGDVEPGSGKHSVFTHFPKDPNCEMCFKTNITRASCWRRAGTVVPRAENFGELDYSGSQSSQWRKCIAEQSPICRGGTRFGNPVVTVLPVQNKIFPGDPEEPHEVPGAENETKSDLHWQFLGIWQSLWRFILESLYVNTTQIRNNWDCWKSISQSKRGDICGAIAVRSG